MRVSLHVQTCHSEHNFQRPVNGIQGFIHNAKDTDRQTVPLKQRQISTRLHGITFCKTAIADVICFSLLLSALLLYFPPYVLLFNSFLFSILCTIFVLFITFSVSCSAFSFTSFVLFIYFVYALAIPLNSSSSLLSSSSRANYARGRSQ